MTWFQYTSPCCMAFFQVENEENIGRKRAREKAAEARSIPPLRARYTDPYAFDALMGAALCSCGGRADDDHALLFGVALDKAKHLQQQHRHALLGFAKSPHKYAGKSPLDQHGSLYHSRGETYELSDDVYVAAQDDDDLHHPHHRTVLLVNRHSSALAIAEAFRMKLQESPISAHEKMQFLLAPRAATSPHDHDANAQDEKETQDSYAKHHPSDEGSYDDDDDESVSEEDWKQRANPLISIIVPPGPCGLVLQVENEPGLPPIVDGFVRRYDGKKGVIENSGMVQKGSVLCAINDIDVSRMPLKEVVRTLNLSSHLERKFVFRDSVATVT
ncbi:hypothetical protein FI667_g7216, partial [Globisporangium splendens]